MYFLPPKDSMYLEAFVIMQSVLSCIRVFFDESTSFELTPFSVYIFKEITLNLTRFSALNSPFSSAFLEKRNKSP